MSSKYKLFRWILLTGCVACALTPLASAVEMITIPLPKPNIARYEELWRGPWQPRLIGSMKTPGLIFCVYNPTQTHTRSLIQAVERHGVGDVWFCGFIDPTLTAFKPFLETGKLIYPYFDQNNVFEQRLAENKPFLEFKQRLETEYPNRFLSFGVGEWENALWIWWQPGKEFATREAVFHISPNEAAGLDRRAFYERALRVHESWKAQLKGRMNSLTGYGLLSHLAAAAGSEFIGIETGENIPATQAKRAFVRGAARQYGLAWFEDISPWYGPSICVGRPNVPDHMPDGTYVGAHAGHSPSMMARLWYSAWFSGAGLVCLEASSSFVFDMPRDTVEVPADVQLSDYGKRAQKLFHLMKNEDIGIPYTPFALLTSKYHGRWSVWGKPWGCFEETPGDTMTVRFFDRLFSAQSKGAGQEERYLCPSRYGDTFDVLVHDAPRSAWGAYPVILAVGDIPWTRADLDFLKQYVQQGGILGLNEINTAGWDRDFLGLAQGSFQPAGGATTLLSSPDGKPLLISRVAGQGRLFVAANRPEAEGKEGQAFPDRFLDDLARAYLPFSIEGSVESLINRTKDGWALLLVNNNGIKKAHKEAPRIDPARTETVRLVFRENPAGVTELLAGDNPAVQKSGADSQCTIAIPPGEMRLLKIRH